jgi:hypothetical protein
MDRAQLLQRIADGADVTVQERGSCGLGDIILKVRLLPELVRHAADIGSASRVTFEMAPRYAGLERLFRASFAGFAINVVAYEPADRLRYGASTPPHHKAEREATRWGRPRLEHELSLDEAWEVYGVHAPFHGPYLAADQKLTDHYRCLIPPDAIGLCWSSTSALARAIGKSLGLERLGPIWRDNQCVSLQMGPAREDAVGTTILDVLPRGVVDWTETAALAAACRCVVTIDTSVAHLAGAIGLPTFVVSPNNYTDVLAYYRCGSSLHYGPNHQVREVGDVVNISRSLTASVERIAAAL